MTIGNTSYTFVAAGTATGGNEAGNQVAIGTGTNAQQATLPNLMAAVNASAQVNGAANSSAFNVAAVNTGHVGQVTVRAPTWPC